MKRKASRPKVVPLPPTDGLKECRIQRRFDSPPDEIIMPFPDDPDDDYWPIVNGLLDEDKYKAIMTRALQQEADNFCIKMGYPERYHVVYQTSEPRISDGHEIEGEVQYGDVLIYTTSLMKGWHVVHHGLLEIHLIDKFVRPYLEMLDLAMKVAVGKPDPEKNSAVELLNGLMKLHQHTIYQAREIEIERIITALEPEPAFRL